MNRRDAMDAETATKQELCVHRASAVEMPSKNLPGLRRFQQIRIDYKCALRQHLWACHRYAGFRRLNRATMAHSTAKHSTASRMRVVQLGTFVFSASKRMVIGLLSSVWRTWLKL